MCDGVDAIETAMIKFCIIIYDGMGTLSNFIEFSTLIWIFIEFLYMNVKEMMHSIVFVQLTCKGLVFKVLYGKDLFLM